MTKLKFKTKTFLFTVSNLEKKHKVITYASLLFLTVSTYFLRTENQNVKVNYATIKERNLNLKKNMVIFNRNYDGFPLPVWQKVKRGNKFIMQYGNPEYVNKFGHFFNYNFIEQIGKDNFELFPESLAQSFYENDIATAITGEVLEIEGTVTGKDGKPMSAKTIKWREIRDNKDTLIYGMVKEFLPQKSVQNLKK